MPYHIYILLNHTCSHPTVIITHAKGVCQITIFSVGTAHLLHLEMLGRIAPFAYFSTVKSPTENKMYEAVRS